MGAPMTKNTLPTGEVTEAFVAQAASIINKNHGDNWTCDGEFMDTAREILAMRKAATPEQDGLVERPAEWFVRDKVTGNFVHADPPQQFTMQQLIDMAQRQAEDAAQIAELRRERDEAQRRDERVREAMFVLSDRLNLIGALDSDNVHAAYEKVVAALTNNGGENGR